MFVVTVFAFNMLCSLLLILLSATVALGGSFAGDLHGDGSEFGDVYENGGVAIFGKRGQQKTF
jgi:hypothetical protein